MCKVCDDYEARANYTESDTVINWDLIWRGELMNTMFRLKILNEEQWKKWAWR